METEIMTATAAKPIADAEIGPLFRILEAQAIDSVILAVSGGTDSLALLHLYARYQRMNPEAPRALVVTVDHGWRPEAAAESNFVAGEANALGLPHETLRWTDAKPATGRQEAARTARYGLMESRLARMPGSRRALLTAHTADDQAETLLMRLARGSGVDGLAGMPKIRHLNPESPILLIRPLLQVTRARLAATLAEIGVAPVDDPSNADQSFERIRMRSALAGLAPLGLTPATLARSATRLQRAQAALNHAVNEIEAKISAIKPGVSTTLDRTAFSDAPEEVQIRLLSRALLRHGGNHPHAELLQIESLALSLSTSSPNTPTAATLGGCTIQWQQRFITVFRELGRDGLPDLDVAPGATAAWDGRFEISLARDAPCPLSVRSLPASLWPRLKPVYPQVPREIAITLPSLWMNGTLVAVPPPGFASSAGLTTTTPCIAPPASDESPKHGLPRFCATLCSMRPLGSPPP